MHHHTGKEKAESFLVFQQHTHHRPYQQAAEAPPGVGTSDRRLTGNHRGASTLLSHIPRRAQNAPIGAFLMRAGRAPRVRRALDIRAAREGLRPACLRDGSRLGSVVFCCAGAAHLSRRPGLSPDRGSYRL